MGTPRRVMNRREFLKGTGAVAASAAASRLPLPRAADAASARQVLSQADVLPPAFEAGFSLPNTGENIVMLNNDAVLWGGDWYGNMTKEQMLANRAILERARQAMPATTDRPLMFNHLTNQWHEEALRHAVPADGGDPASWQRVFMKSGRRAPDAHNLLQTETYLPEDFGSSAWESGTLTKGAFGGKRPNAVDGFEDEWWRDRRGALQGQLREKGGNAKEMAQSDDGVRLIQELGLAPGGRANHDKPVGVEVYRRGPLRGLMDETSIGGSVAPPLPTDDFNAPRRGSDMRRLRYSPALLAPLLQEDEEQR